MKLSKNILKITEFGTATLGSVLDAIAAAPADADVQFGFCYLRPTAVHSYRGYYDHCAIGWSSKAAGEDRHWPSAGSVTAELQKAVGHTYGGWKGGDYRMSRDTPLWVDLPGDCSNTAIVDVVIEGKTVIIKTMKVDFW